MGIFTTNKKVEQAGEYVSMSTPFMSVGKGNLALPFVNRRSRRMGAVCFGADNLFPQLINQMYYASPLHGSIMDYKVRATTGGGYNLKPKSNDMDVLVATSKFRLKYDLDSLLPEITQHLFMHYRYYKIIEFRNENGRMIPVNMEDVSPEEVRVCDDKQTYIICEDWSTCIGAYSIPKLHPNCKSLRQLFVYEKKTIGQKYYPIPQYTSANNWFFLDGEMSFLHKTNILESIFPSFALFFPKKPAGDDELNAVKDKVNEAKGAQNAGRIFTFFAGSKEAMPELVDIPKNNNDQLFVQTDHRIDEKICQSHTIDPILMGIRVSGELGSGSDIQQSYIIFEKNQVIPMRKEAAEIVRDLMRIFNVPAEFEINNFQIINETIIEVDNAEDDDIVETLSKISPLVANKILENLTPNELRRVIRLKALPGGDKIPVPQAAEKPDGSQVQMSKHFNVNVKTA